MAGLSRGGAFLWLAGLCLGLSCAEYTPRPRGYFRIEPPQAVYTRLAADSFPFSFHVSSLAGVEAAPLGVPGGGITLRYPALDAAIYCTYLPLKPSGPEEVFRESHRLMLRQARNVRSVNVQSYSNPQEAVYALLYESEGATASPLQFVLTDSARHFFRGTLLYSRPAPPDSLAPVTRYLKADIVELIQSFKWKVTS